MRAELAKRWPASEIEALHRQASRWLEQQGFIESAIRHALAGASPVEAAKIVERHRLEELDREHWRTLEAWLDLIPADVKKERLESLLGVAWVVHFSGRRDVLRLIVREIDSRLAHESPSGSVLAEVHLVKGLAAYWAGDGSESQRRFEKVAELSPRAKTFPVASPRSISVWRGIGTARATWPASRSAYRFSRSLPTFAIWGGC